MGADMIVATVAIKKDAGMDFEAGVKFICNLKAEDLDLELLETQGFDVEEFVDENDKIILSKVITALRDMLTEFQEAITGRATTVINVRDLYVYVTGGMSWGDVNDECTAFWQVNSIPGLLTAMRFDEYFWNEDAPPAVTPEEEAAAIDSIVGSENRCVS